jgi:geranylgeranyl pyrophosphate synthase
VLTLVADDLARVEAKMRGTEAGMLPDLAEAFLALIASGGKRLRPALALMAARFFPHGREQAIALAAAVETLHTATLVHDDVIDNALIRRGSPTLNAVWTSGATVLAGDYLFARAAGFAAETGHIGVIQLFARTLGIICEGELRQLSALRRWDQPREAYYARIYAKTASLFAAATEGGALLGTSDETTVSGLRDYGHYLGMAFQIIDDILDFTSTEAVLGKPAGSDLRQGTVTLPVFYYMQDLPEPATVQRQLEEAWQANGTRMSALVSQIAESPAINLAYGEAASFVAQAKAALDPLPDDENRAALVELADMTLVRHH